MQSYKTKIKPNTNPRIRINVNDKIIHVKLKNLINDKEIQNLIKHLENIKLQSNFYKFIIILPKKWKSPPEAQKMLIDFIKSKNYIVAHSAILRALLKTETIFAGENTEFICKSEMEALNKINHEFYQS